MGTLPEERASRKDRQEDGARDMEVSEMTTARSH